METFGAFERHELPNGEAVYYRDSSHSYHTHIEEKGGKWVGPKDSRIPSPSTIGKILDTSNEGLLRWAAKQTCRGVIELHGRYADDDPEALWGALVRNKLTYSDLREQRATEGTNVHEKVLGCLAAGERVPSLSDVTLEERGYAQGVLAAWHDLDPDPIVSEAVVFHPEYRYAGRIDLLCTIKGRLTLLDLKTGYVGNGAHCQLAGYIAATEASGYGTVEDATILKVDDHGGYELIPCAAEPEDFFHALAAYRSASSVGKRSRKHFKEAKAAQALEQAA